MISDMDAMKRIRKLSPLDSARLGILHPENIDFTITQGHRSWADQVDMELNRKHRHDHADALRFAFPERGRVEDFPPPRPLFVAKVDNSPRHLKPNEVEATFKEPPMLSGPTQ